jgi:hypothetical protein
MVTFTNLSTPTQAITRATWAYGDGVISHTLALTHTHTYTRPGVYSVTLSAGDGVRAFTYHAANRLVAVSGLPSVSGRGPGSTRCVTAVSNAA